MMVPKSMQKEQNVHADIFNWHDNQFIIFVLKPCRVLLVQWLPTNRTAKELTDAVNNGMIKKCV